MAAQQDQNRCPPELLQAAIDAAKVEGEGLAEVEGLLRNYARDPRLHFFKGSLLAGLKRYGEARRAMRRALHLEPDYTIARFQLGLLELTSGEAAAAALTWRALENLAIDDPLRLISRGLQHLARDEFGLAVALLAKGQAINAAYPAVNADMQMIIDQLRSETGDKGARDQPTTATQLLLQKYHPNATKH